MAQIHHHDPVAEIPHDGEVVADEKKCRLVFALNLHQQVRDGGLHRHIQCRDRFIRHHDPCITGEGPRDADTLFLPT